MSFSRAEVGVKTKQILLDDEEETQGSDKVKTTMCPAAAALSGEELICLAHCGLEVGAVSAGVLLQ